MRKISVKYILLSLLAFVIVVATGYKYYEWHSLNTLAEEYNSTWKDELEMVETLNTTNNEFYFLLNTDDEQTPEEIDKLLTKTNLLLDQAEQYKAILQKNKKDYEAISAQPNLLLTNKKEFSDELIKVKLAYYDQELAQTEKNIVSLYFLHDLFNMGKDSLIVQEFEANAQGDSEYYKNIQEVVVIKKYTEDNYQFDHEDEIKKHYPKAYDFLGKSKDFYRTYYEVVEDFAKGDLESAGYKATKLQEDAVELNIDPEELLKDANQEEEIKKSLENVATQIALIKKFEKHTVTKYPFLPSITAYEEDLVLCQFYAYKSMQLYSEVMIDYPKAKNTDELLKELDKISPRTKALDAEFDKNALVLKNTDKKISFACSDLEKKNSFTFASEKNEQ